jgi:hypothetical protein
MSSIISITWSLVATFFLHVCFLPISAVYPFSSFRLAASEHYCCDLAQSLLSIHPSGPATICYDCAHMLYEQGCDVEYFSVDQSAHISCSYSIWSYITVIVFIYSIIFILKYFIIYHIIIDYFIFIVLFIFIL